MTTASPDPTSRAMEAAARRRRETRNQAIFVILFLVGMLVILNAFGAFRRAKPGTHDITFRVEGSASTALITYTQPDGHSSPKFDASLPWSKTINFPKDTLVILTAGNTTETGNIRCILLLDGGAWKREENNNPGDKVSCAAMVP